MNLSALSECDAAKICSKCRLKILKFLDYYCARLINEIFVEFNYFTF